MTTVHVYPTRDLIEHIDTDDCSCGPSTEAVFDGDGSNGWLVTHRLVRDEVGK